MVVSNWKKSACRKLLGRTGGSTNISRRAAARLLMLMIRSAARAAPPSAHLQDLRLLGHERASVGRLMDSLMNATTHSATDRTEPTRPDRELPAKEHFPARASTIRHRLERAHNPKVRGNATSVGLPRRANRTRMSPLCPTVVVGLPGTPGSVKTRAYQFFLGVCGLSGTSRNLPEPRNGACYGRCAVVVIGRVVSLGARGRRAAWELADSGRARADRPAPARRRWRRPRRRARPAACVNPGEVHRATAGSQRGAKRQTTRRESTQRALA